MSSLHPATGSPDLAALSFADLTAQLRAANLRLLTARKCVKPAQRWSLCATCDQPVGNHDAVAIIGGIMHHAACR